MIRERKKSSEERKKNDNVDMVFVYSSTVNFTNSSLGHDVFLFVPTLFNYRGSARSNIFHFNISVSVLKMFSTKLRRLFLGMKSTRDRSSIY